MSWVDELKKQLEKPVKEPKKRVRPAVMDPKTLAAAIVDEMEKRKGQPRDRILEGMRQHYARTKKVWWKTVELAHLTGLSSEVVSMTLRALRRESGAVEWSRQHGRRWRLLDIP